MRELHAGVACMLVGFAVICVGVRYAAATGTTCGAAQGHKDDGEYSPWTLQCNQGECDLPTTCQPYEYTSPPDENGVYVTLTTCSCVDAEGNAYSTTTGKNCDIAMTTTHYPGQNGSPGWSQTSFDCLKVDCTENCHGALTCVDPFNMYSEGVYRCTCPD